MNFITTDFISSQLLSDRHSYPDCGAKVTFDGIVRNHHEGKNVVRLSYQAYEPMAEKVLANLKCEAESKWPDCHIEVIHRIGDLKIGDVAVAIVAWAPHRQEAFQACEWMINSIKKTVPIWKREFYADGNISWVQCHHHAS